MSVTVHVTPTVSYSYENRADVVKALEHSKNHQAALEKWLEDNPKTIGDLPDSSYEIILRRVNGNWSAKIDMQVKSYFAYCAGEAGTPDKVVAQLKEMVL